MKLLRQEILMTWRAEWFHTKGAFCDKLREINYLIVIVEENLNPFQMSDLTRGVKSIVLAHLHFHEISTFETGLSCHNCTCHHTAK